MIEEIYLRRGPQHRSLLWQSGGTLGCFTPESGRRDLGLQCPLSAISRHQAGLDHIGGRDGRVPSITLSDSDAIWQVGYWNEFS